MLFTIINGKLPLSAECRAPMGNMAIFHIQNSILLSLITVN